MPFFAYHVGRNFGIIGAAMDTNNPITAAVFSAFLKCPTKAHLMAIGEPAPSAYFRRHRGAHIVYVQSGGQAAVCPSGLRWPNFSISESCGAAATMKPSRIMSTAKQPSMTCALAATEPGAANRGNRRHPAPLSPFCFHPGTNPMFPTAYWCVSVRLRCRRSPGFLADTGTVIYGEGHRRKTVKIGDHAVRTRQTIDAIVATCHSREPPPLVLNRHCAVCDFQPRCRGLAIERDNLSLLSAMTGKERAKCNAKGIFSITQLSYGYRPRRRKRNRPDAESSKTIWQTRHSDSQERPQTQGSGDQEEPNSCRRGPVAKVRRHPDLPRR